MKKIKSKEKPSHITFVIVPPDSSKIRRIVFSKRGLKLSGIIIGVFLSFLIVSTVFLFLNLWKLNQFNILKENNAQHTKRLKEFMDKLISLQNELSTLKDLERKLRIIANIEMPTFSQETMPGVGGYETIDKVLEGAFNSKGGISDTTQSIMEKRIQRDIEIMAAEIKDHKDSVEKLISELDSKRTYLASVPSIWPVRGWVTSEFGYRESPFTTKRKMHEGIDIATRIGTPVVSTGNGVVIFAGSEYSYGKVVIIDHGYGIYTRYAHNNEIYVRTGQSVKRGEVIAVVGNTGLTTGPHLHYEVRISNIPVNPRNYIVE